MLPELEKTEALTGPYEILELLDKQVVALQPLRFQLGKALINPRDGRAAKVIHVLRLWVDKTSKPTLPDYWDITAAHLIAGMIGHLESGGGLKKSYKITKYGSGARARFTLDVLPVSAG
jgi:hypothetical protein